MTKPACRCTERLTCEQCYAASGLLTSEVEPAALRRQSRAGIVTGGSEVRSRRITAPSYGTPGGRGLMTTSDFIGTGLMVVSTVFSTAFAASAQGAAATYTTAEADRGAAVYTE